MLLGSNLVQKFRRDLEIMSELSEGALSFNSSGTRGAVEFPCHGIRDHSVFCTHNRPLGRVPALFVISSSIHRPSPSSSFLRSMKGTSASPAESRVCWRYS